MRTALLAAAVVTVVGVAVATTLQGADGAVGALLGGLVVVVFLGSTPLLLTPAVKANASASLATALGFFMVKIAVVTALLVVLFDVAGAAQVASPEALGLTALAVALTWTTAQVVAFRRDRTAIYDLDNSRPEPPGNLGGAGPDHESDRH